MLSSAKFEFEYLENEKSFFMWDKKHFSQLFKGYHLLNKKKITNTSFKLSKNFLKYHFTQKQV